MCACRAAAFCAGYVVYALLIHVHERRVYGSATIFKLSAYKTVQYVSECAIWKINIIFFVLDKKVIIKRPFLAIFDSDRSIV